MSLLATHIINKNCSVLSVYKKWLNTFLYSSFKEIGEMTVTVENATWRGKPCYLVHANSHGTVDQVPIGTSVTGTV